MDLSAAPWLYEMELENPNFTDLDAFDFPDSFDDDFAAIIGQDFETSLAPIQTSSTSRPNVTTTRALQIDRSTESGPSSGQNTNHSNQLNYNSSNFSNLIHQDIGPNNRNRNHRFSSSPTVLTFGHKTCPEEYPHHHHLGSSPSQSTTNQEAAAKTAPELNNIMSCDTKKSTTTRVRPPWHSYDHNIAERKRRQLLSLHFHTLSTIVPGLKKTDKTSVLGDAIKYLKQLQEKVRMLEEKTSKKTMESAVVVKRSRVIVADDDDGGEKRQCTEEEEQPLPEIEVRMCNSKTLLIKVGCEMRKGVLGALIDCVENLSLTIVNTNVVALGSWASDITVVAQMQESFEVSPNEVVKRLGSAIHLSTY